MHKFLLKYVCVCIADANNANNPTTLSNVFRYVDTAVELMAALPDFVRGFDLVSQEDLGNPLIDFSEQLLSAQAQGRDKISRHSSQLFNLSYFRTYVHPYPKIREI